jgi:DNA replication and repair protein RecF
VRHGAGGFRIGARLENPEERESLRVEIELGANSPKKILIDKARSRASDLLAKVKVVSFAPSDVELVQGSARSRRRFLDLIGCQVSGEYLRLLREYQRVIRQRNETLARSFVFAHGRKAAAEAREPWTGLLIETGAELIERRLKLVLELARVLSSLTIDAFRGAGPAMVSYAPAVPLKVGAEGGDLRSALREATERRVGKDEALGYTTVGPHTDELRIELDGREHRRFGSLGQQQLCAMFLKLAQAELVRSWSGAPALLLVDEMFAILDRRAAEGFLEKVEREGGQIFLATAQEGWLAELEGRGFHVHRVEAGRVGATGAPDGKGPGAAETEKGCSRGHENRVS